MMSIYNKATKYLHTYAMYVSMYLCHTYTNQKLFFGYFLNKSLLMGLSNYVSTYQNDYSGSNGLSKRHRSKSASTLNVNRFSTGRVPTSDRQMSNEVKK